LRCVTGGFDTFVIDVTGGETKTFRSRGSIGDLLTDEPPPSASQFHQRRLAATYVDVSNDGAVQTPGSAVSKQEFEAIFESIDRELRFCEGILAKATPQQLAPVLESMRTSPRASALTELLDELGADTPQPIGLSTATGRATSYSE
jgi:hypothetical protein